MVRDLASKYGYSPQTIADMTPAQQYLMVSEEATGTIHFNSEAELNNYMQGKRTS